MSTFGQNPGRPLFGGSENRQFCLAAEAAARCEGLHDSLHHHRIDVFPLGAVFDRLTSGPVEVLSVERCLLCLGPTATAPAPDVVATQIFPPAFPFINGLGAGSDSERASSSPSSLCSELRKSSDTSAAPAGAGKASPPSAGAGKASPLSAGAGKASPPSCKSARGPGSGAKRRASPPAWGTRSAP